LIGNGLKLEDIQLLYFSDMGFGMFGNSLIAHPDVISNNPSLVHRVASAVSEAWVYGSTHREQAIDAVVKREKLLDPKVQLGQLSWVYEKHILTENVKRNGLGSFEMSRLSKGIELIQQGFGLAQAPRVESIYDGSFLPPLKERSFA
jgi:NitT/TauT family transport system substrate-binding protein